MRTLLLSLLLAGCATEAPPAMGGRVADTSGAPAAGAFESEADYRRQREATAEALAAALTPATASDASACRVVATSEQACGGPTTFAVYSAERAGSAEVVRLAARLVALDEAANAQFAYVSTCMAYAPPVPVLRDGVCADPQPAP